MHSLLFVVMGETDERALGREFECARLLISHGATWNRSFDELLHQERARCLRKDHEIERLLVLIREWVDQRDSGKELTVLPVEVYIRGADDIQAFFKAAAKSATTLYRKKLCVVGPSTWGKTSLITRFDDLIRQVINHKLVDEAYVTIMKGRLRELLDKGRGEGCVPHELMEHLELWRDLDDQQLMLQLKLLLSDALVVACSDQLNCTVQVHSLVKELVLSDRSTLEMEQCRTLSPDETLALLRDLLRVYDPEFDEKKMTMYSGLECGIVVDTMTEPFAIASGTCL